MLDCLERLQRVVELLNGRNLTEQRYLRAEEGAHRHAPVNASARARTHTYAQVRSARHVSAERGFAGLALPPADALERAPASARTFSAAVASTPLAVSKFLMASLHEVAFDISAAY